MAPQQTQITGARTMESDTDAGGTKKFLYSGPHCKNSGFEDEVEDREWNFKGPPSTDNSTASHGGEFDLDGVWSIKKNVGVSKVTHKPSVQEGWSMNVGKGLYSRHGGIQDDNEFDFGNGSNQNSAESNPSQWGQQPSKGYSYSYKQSSSSPGSGCASSGPASHTPIMTDDSRRGGPPPGFRPAAGGNNIRPTAGNHGGRYGVHNTGMHLNNRQF